jgi:hypothetical protein
LDEALQLYAADQVDSHLVHLLLNCAALCQTTMDIIGGGVEVFDAILARPSLQMCAGTTLLNYLNTPP